jgi:alpha-ketoglutarate-dependent taurine dioxygenase
MSLKKNEELSFSKRLVAGKKPIRLSERELVKSSYLDATGEFPVVIEPNIDDVNLICWISSNREYIEKELLRCGAILFRGFDINSADQFDQFARNMSFELLDYVERAAPRSQVTGRIYTSTEYPASQRIPLHHEMSYSHNWPTKIFFYCARSAEKGGQTPIANDRKIYKLLPSDIKQRFIEKKVMYIRNYGEGVDLPWQEAFQTTDRSKVEAYCRKSGMDIEWVDGTRLRTRQIRQAVATHPKTLDIVWFNHAHMFHLSNLEPAVRESLLSQFRDDELPRNAFYGDGSRIESSILDEIRGIYQNAAVIFPWQTGDILLLDNFLTSHGREPYEGARTVLVAMAELFTSTDI